MEIKRVKLISTHQYNFRHGYENPIVIGVVVIEHLERLCYEVCFPSDGRIDYVAFESVKLGNWRFDNAN